MSSIRTIMVLGPWGCGSTAVAGYLAQLGAFTAPPHQPTNDPRTPDSHEPRALRDALAARVDRSGLRRAEAQDEPFAAWLERWVAGERERAEDRGYAHLVLKQPLLAFFIAEARAACDPEFIVVTRPLEAIEATRQRRGWGENHGRGSAEMIYERIFEGENAGVPRATVCPYEQFRTDPDFRHHLCSNLGFHPDRTRRSAAERWLR